ncbi:hypothetical protein SLS60_003579 [Paraconiothyrium brasiliense]|uniref:Uncharacterized protein n=1 Tax=Paraconiothyrium brasiliense TaxID=300254 RepID=A0ABR3RPP5_9PLEO
MASPNEPLRAYIHLVLLGIDHEQPDKQNRQFPVLAGNITSLVRSIRGPNAEPKHVTIRVANVRENNGYGPITAQKAHVVIHNDGLEGDKLLVEAVARPEKSIVVALAEEIDRVTLRAMEAMKTKEEMDEAVMLAAFRLKISEQFSSLGDMGIFEARWIKAC